MKRDGTVLMEAVLCLPLLVALCIGVAEFSRLWQARFLAFLAADHAARAALVHNPADYADGSGSFFEREGVAWAAAVETLAPLAQRNGLGGGLFPDRTLAAARTRIVPEKSAERDETVSVTVEFRLPHLLAPVIPLSDGRPAPWTLFSHAVVTETCVLPKPWSTEGFPRLSDEERDFLVPVPPAAPEEEPEGEKTGEGSGEESGETEEDA